ncbi:MULTISPECIES: DUF2812 domain-containing protein [unclassified Fusibacter]|uniref:DUF2812 domain-containing protein n=1 Tax=unclassified Fusibacter TaxID=2624464 RepID=UPI001011B4B0|nr:MULTISPECIES: DUF2812 domain-containing protein [unclassified Fusibacter]MCK8058376.1 DUF2812 domain-containing protein [Fusibacter sp. A2]NPE20959.1 DUF2812 domain-containing protein [Fusibacter sp. A1]RXV63161.1 DUF2812 domain-containing protein [Fusibacter sp. A1]
MKKVVYKALFAWQEEKEAAFLEEMGRQGWLLVDVLPFRYTFVEGQADEYVYQFDYSRMSAGQYMENQRFLESFGWEKVTQLLGWHYYRGLRSELESVELYTDQDSLKDKYKHLFRLFAILGGINLMSFINLMNISQRAGGSVRWVGLLNLGVSVLLFYAMYKIYSKVKKYKAQI